MGHGEYRESQEFAHCRVFTESPRQSQRRDNEPAPTNAERKRRERSEGPKENIPGSETSERATFKQACSRLSSHADGTRRQEITKPLDRSRRMGSVLGRRSEITSNSADQSLANFALVQRMIGAICS